LEGLVRLHGPDIGLFDRTIQKTAV